MNHPATRANERGQAIVILAFAMIVLLAFAALAIDGGNAYVNRRRAQNAADGGALAGARQLWIYRTGEATNIRAAINKSAEENGMPDSDGVSGNAVNTHVRAFYTDKLGQRLESGGEPIEVSPVIPPPAAAQGVEVTAGLEYSTFIAGIFSRGQQGTGSAEAQAVAIVKLPVGCGDYAVYGAGPSGHDQSIHETGSDLTFHDGGLYGGEGGQMSNVTLTGNPPPPVDIYGDCTHCDVTGSIVNSLSEAQEPPALYDISDYQPGGKYAVEVGSNYHYYSGNFPPTGHGYTGNLNGLYFVERDVSLHDVTGNVSIVTRGNIDIQGGATLTTFDPRFPLLFTTSDNVTSGAVGTHDALIELHGFIYAPNGAVNMTGATGTIYGAIYGKTVKFSGAHLDFYYEPAYCPPQRATVVLLR